MNTDQVSRRGFITKAVNKENTEPGHGPKSFIKRDVQKAKALAAPFQQKRNEAAQTLARNDLTKAASTKTTSEVVKRRIASRQIDGIGSVVGNVKQRPTQNQVPIGKQRQDVTEAPKPHAQPSAAMASSKSALGMYKGKIIQSKIGSIWKQSTDGEQKPRTERVGNLTKSRSKSVTDTSARSRQKPAPARSKSVDRGKLVTKPTVTTRPLGAARSARPPTRGAATMRNRNTSVPPKGTSGTQSLKPKESVTDKKVNKPPVRSTLSQYRTTESKEERKARLEEWLVSKGKTLKRPAMTTAVSTTSAKPKVPQHKPEPSVQTDKEDSVADVNANAEDKKAKSVTHKQTPVVMNTTLDLLENSAELPDAMDDVDDRVDDIVVNLCDALEAMETPSRCEDEPPEMDESQDAKSKEIVKDKEIEKEMCYVEQVKEEACDDKGEASDCEESDEDDDDAMKTTAHTEEASVVRYSVKTTPYLQSVKRTIADEVATSGSRRKSNIKDLKFLTPVRRSSRIQRNSSQLPTMLVDHDPCVSSLAELGQLDGDCNAYIYRRNPAILDDMPDESLL